MQTNLLLNTFFSVFVATSTQSSSRAQRAIARAKHAGSVLGVNVPLPKQHAVAVLLQGLKKREDVKLLIKKDV